MPILHYTSCFIHLQHFSRDWVRRQSGFDAVDQGYRFVTDLAHGDRHDRETPSTVTIQVGESMVPLDGKASRGLNNERYG